MTRSGEARRGGGRATADREVLARLDDVPGGGRFCTSWVKRGTRLTQPQAYRVMRSLADSGVVENHGYGLWSVTDAGQAYLASRDRGFRREPDALRAARPRPEGSTS